MIAHALLVSLLALAIVPANAIGAASAVPQPRPLARDVERLPTAEAQLRHASTLHRAYREARGAARAAAREAAIAAYEAVPAYHPRARAASAEAWFRAGELRRAQGRDADALRLFRSCVRVSSPGRLRARATLECGHLHRRAARFPEALSAYERVERDVRAAPKYRDLATYWRARVLLEQEREEDARRVLRDLAARAADPLTVVRAYDELALSAIREGDAEWAAGLIERCRKQLAGPLAEETTTGRRVRNAFRDMRCRARLAELVARRRRESED